MQKRVWTIFSVMALGVIGLAYQPVSAKVTETTGAPTLQWWGHSAFIVRTPQGTTLAIDPWLKNPRAPKDAKWPSKLDAILITHGHSDHVGDAVELAKRTGAPIIGSHELVSILGVPKSIGANIGGSVRIKDATIHLVEAVHSSGYSTEPREFQYAGTAMGYVIQIDKGPTIYHAGDTALFSDMALIGEMYKPNYSLLPIGGQYTMDPTTAARAAKMLHSQYIIPMHFGTFPLLAGNPVGLRAALARHGIQAQVVEFQPGKTNSLRLQ